MVCQIYTVHLVWGKGVKACLVKWYPCSDAEKLHLKLIEHLNPLLSELIEHLFLTAYFKQQN